MNGSPKAKNNDKYFENWPLQICKQYLKNLNERTMEKANMSQREDEKQKSRICHYWSFSLYVWCNAFVRTKKYDFIVCYTEQNIIQCVRIYSMAMHLSLNGTMKSRIYIHIDTIENARFIIRFYVYLDLHIYNLVSLYGVRYSKIKYSISMYKLNGLTVHGVLIGVCMISSVSDRFLAFSDIK